MTQVNTVALRKSSETNMREAKLTYKEHVCTKSKYYQEYILQYSLKCLLYKKKNEK